MASLKSNRNCTDCLLHKEAETVNLMGSGDIPSDIMVIGDSPTYQDDLQEKPFTGREGSFLRKALSENGIDLKAVFKTNVVKCKAKKVLTSNVKQCSPYLDREFKKVKPKFVLLLGATALRAIPELQTAKVTKIRGQIHKFDRPWGDMYVMATYHPKACFFGKRDRKDKHTPNFLLDVRMFGDLVKTGKPREYEKMSLKSVTDETSFIEMIKDIRDADPIVSLDLETMCLDTWEMRLKKNKIVSIGIGLNGTNWACPIYHKDNMVFHKKTRIMALNMILDAVKDKLIVTHNGKFDAKWLHSKTGRFIKIHFDTMLAHFELHEEDPHALTTYLVPHYFNGPNYDIPLEEKWGYGPWDRHAEYLGYDIYYTRKLYYPLMEEMNQWPGVKDSYNNLRLPAFNAFIKMEQHGMPLRLKQMSSANEQIENDMKQKTQKIKLMLSGLDLDPPKKKKGIMPTYFANISRAKNLIKILHEDMKLPVLARTDKKKEPKTDKNVLKELTNLEPKPWVNEVYSGTTTEFIQLILDMKAMRKRKEFLDSWGVHGSVDGRLHVNYKFLPVTGRLSCADPNIQQTPRDELIRSCMGGIESDIEGLDEWTLVEGDYSQAELRMMAHYSRDPVMQRIFLEGGDIHLATAMDLTGLPADKITYEQRKRAKAVNFGFIFTMSAKTFKEYAKMSYDLVLTDAESEAYYKGFHKKYRKVRSYHNLQRRKVREYGYVQYLHGRIRHLPYVFSDDESVQREAERQAINSPIQGFVSDMNLMATLEIMDEFNWNTEVRPLGLIHDANLFLVRTKYLREIVPRIKEIMTRPKLMDYFEIYINVPIIADIKIGDWGKGKEVTNIRKWRRKKGFREFMGDEIADMQGVKAKWMK